MAKNEYTVGDMKDKKEFGRGPGGPGGPGRMAGQKARDFKGTGKKLLAYSRAYLPVVIFAFILAIAGSVLSVIGPDKLKDITNIIQKGIMAQIDLAEVGKIGVTLVTIYVLALVFNYSQGFIMATVTQRITKTMRTDIADKINRVPLKYFDGTSYGDVLSRVTNDVDTIGQTLNNSIGTLITAVAGFLGATVMMFYTNWIMALSGILATLVGFMMMTVLLKQSQKFFIGQQRELGKINGHIEETYAGHNIVKVYNGEVQAKETFYQINNALYKNAWKAQFVSGLMMPIMAFVGNFGYVVVCIVGALLVTKGSVTIGTIVAFMIYIRLFTNPLAQMAQAATNLQATVAAGERVMEFLAEEELEKESDQKQELRNVKGDVEFKQVRFGYNQDKVVIKNFSARAKAGQKVAIVGPTGAGKTTIVNLLMRFYEVNSGDILIDGISTRDLKRENVHDLFCMVLQDTWLFEGTIKENIIYSKKGVTDEEVIRACKAVGVHHFVKALPKGYDTVLNDKANLSAGQKQLITIARAMVENAPLLILDEATSSVDTRTEVLIQEAMDKLMTGKTTFVIAHRLSTVRNADLILVMKDGDIVETGNHEELLEKGGFYAELYNSQFEEEIA